jgi:NAD(P)H-dependent flavin oxidoreductase YrpB (nitropropane dioxygenase family)
MIHTKACEVLGIAHPVVQAGMGGGSSPDLVAAVSEAGGLGILACSWTEPDDIRAQIADIRARTSKPFGVNFVLHVTEPAKIDLAIAERVPVISLFRGSDPSAIVARAHAAGLVTTHQITTVEEARLSLAAGVDVLIAQGREAGGHMGPHPLWTLLPEILGIAGDRPVLASGGLVDGRDLAAVLAMGAAGVHMGTRFLASAESPATAAHKQAILDARDGDTLDTGLWDELWGAAWPGVKVRAFRNKLTERWHGRDAELAENIAAVRAEFEAANAADDTTKRPMLAGEGSTRISAILPAAEIVRSVVAEGGEILRETARLVG